MIYSVQTPVLAIAALNGKKIHAQAAHRSYLDYWPACRDLSNNDVLRATVFHAVDDGDVFPDCTMCLALIERENADKAKQAHYRALDALIHPEAIDIIRTQAAEFDAKAAHYEHAASTPNHNPATIHQAMDRARAIAASLRLIADMAQTIATAEEQRRA